MATKKYCVRCRGWYAGSGEHLCQTVEDGHEYHLSASITDNCNDDGREVYTLTVRAWDLPSALQIAGTQPLSVWTKEESCDD